MEMIGDELLEQEADRESRRAERGRERRVGRAPRVTNELHVTRDGYSLQWAMHHWLWLFSPTSLTETGCRERGWAPWVTDELHIGYRCSLRRAPCHRSWILSLSSSMRGERKGGVPHAVGDLRVVGLHALGELLATDELRADVHSYSLRRAWRDDKDDVEQFLSDVVLLCVSPDLLKCCSEFFRMTKESISASSRMMSNGYVLYAMDFCCNNKCESSRSLILQIFYGRLDMNGFCGVWIVVLWCCVMFLDIVVFY